MTAAPIQFMSLQEQEHYEFEAGRGSELENCLTEAHDVLREMAYPEVEGEGEFLVEVQHEYRCRSTDAHVGFYVCRAVRFATRPLAQEFLNGEYESDPDIYCTLTPAEPPAPLVIVAYDDDDSCPF